jgi:RNA polymerase-binding transcription factor DksA
MGKMQSKMTKTEMKPFKQILVALRARLRGDVSTLADAALASGGKGGSASSAVPSHMADMGTDTYEQDNTLLLMHNEEETLNQIESALERIDNGTYGFCTECGSRIPKARINALPYTPYCVKCASEIQSAGL